MPHIRTFLDQMVEGGRFFELSDGGAIIEICGSSGSGKTLFWCVECINILRVSLLILLHPSSCQLCVSVSLPKDLDGPGAESIFIETDGKFYPSRLIGKNRDSFLDFRLIVSQVCPLRCLQWGSGRTRRQRLDITHRLSLHSETPGRSRGRYWTSCDTVEVQL